MAWASTSQVHHKDMDKVPDKNPPGTSQVHSECSQPVSLQCSWVRKWLVHSRCSRSCDQGVPIRNTIGTFKIFPKKVPRIFLSSSFRMFPVVMIFAFFPRLLWLSHRRPHVPQSREHLSFFSFLFFGHSKDLSYLILSHHHSKTKAKLMSLEEALSTWPKN